MFLNPEKQQITATSRLVVINENSLGNGILTRHEVLNAKVKAMSMDFGLRSLNIEPNNQLPAIITLVGNQDFKISDIEFIPDEAFMNQ